MEELPVFACWDKQLLRAARDEALETVPQQSSGAAEPENSVHSEYPTEPDTGG